MMWGEAMRNVRLGGGEKTIKGTIKERGTE